jgi:hypothetical protein
MQFGDLATLGSLGRTRIAHSSTDTMLKQRRFIREEKQQLGLRLWVNYECAGTTRVPLLLPSREAPDITYLDV